MTATPQVSVVIPSFNAARFIENTLASAAASRDVSIEIIVVDDGSSDGTVQLLESAKPAIRLLHQERKGPYSARNLAFAAARGEWIAFLDADDEWMPEKLSLQLAKAASTGTKLVYTNRLNFGDLRFHKELQTDSVLLHEGDIFEPLLLGNFITLSSVLMHRTAFEDLGGFSIERRGVQDWDLWLRYSGKGGLVSLCPDPLTRYRLHANQMTNDRGSRADDREDVLRRALESPRGKQVALWTKRRAFAHLWTLAASPPFSGRRLEALAYYFRAAWCWPWNQRTYIEMAKVLLGKE